MKHLFRDVLFAVVLSVGAVRAESPPSAEKLPSLEELTRVTPPSETPLEAPAPPATEPSHETSPVHVDLEGKEGGDTVTVIISGRNETGTVRVGTEFAPKHIEHDENATVSAAVSTSLGEGVTARGDAVAPLSGVGAGTASADVAVNLGKGTTATVGTTGPISDLSSGNASVGVSADLGSGVTVTAGMNAPMKDLASGQTFSAGVNIPLGGDPPQPNVGASAPQPQAPRQVEPPAPPPQASQQVEAAPAEAHPQHAPSDRPDRSRDLIERPDSRGPMDVDRDRLKRAGHIA